MHTSLLPPSPSTARSPAQLPVIIVLLLLLLVVVVVVLSLI